MSLLTLLVVGLVLSVLFGGFGWRRGYYGGGPYALPGLVRGMSDTPVTLLR